MAASTVATRKPRVWPSPLTARSAQEGADWHQAL